MKKTQEQTIEDLRAALEKAHAREEFLRNIVLQFHKETQNLGLVQHSKAYADSMCVYAGDWQENIDIHLAKGL